ncbi:MAG: SsrA-binding protein SmpB [Bacteroidetes bacterium]|jgi:SsrA-binding protein|nr:SsrA-binding protein SmpB [Bacteroidota bacterium]MCL5033832.1 SsrA-binding protein SmpB [Bacteroidota bacterium]
MEPEEKTVAQNRRARFEYQILETTEAGIVLKGSEVKSVRQGKVDISDCFASVKDGEVWLHNMHVAAYQNAGAFGHNPRRTRKLLLHRREIRKLIGKTKQKGLSLVPIRLYWKHGLAKVELAIAKGKQAFDKRETIKQRDQEREMRRRGADA